MNKEQMNNIFMISKVFASPKRLLILEFLSNEPMGYTKLTRKFERREMLIGSSEVYKHLEILINAGFVSQKKKLKRGGYIITKRGLFAVEKVKEIAGTEAKVPKIRMEF